MGNKFDLFADLSWGDLNRYKARHDRTIREERAKELDERIRALIKREKTVAWANAAVEFCDRETTQNKDVFQISQEAHRLPKLKEEAQLIIKQEKERIEEERRIAAANAAAAVKNVAADADATIAALASAPRSGYWCREVKDMDAEVQKMARESRVLLKNLSLLQKLLKEAELLLEAESVDERIRALKKDTKRGKDWLNSMDLLRPKITTQVRPLLKEADAWEELQKEYLRVTRSPIFSEYAHCLGQIEEGKWTQETVRNKFQTLNRDLGKHNFSMGEYVTDFQSRWASAKMKVDAENKRLAEAEIARKAAEREAANKQKAQPYDACLKQVEAGRFDQKHVRDEFDKLDKTARNLDTEISKHIDKFQTRWADAKKKVEAEKRRIAELERAEQERLAKIAAEQREIARKRRAAEERREKLLKAIGVFFGIVGPLALMFVGFLIAANLECRWFAPFFVAVSSILLIHCGLMDVDNCVNPYAIIGQIAFYGGSIAFSLMQGYGIVNMIVCVVLVAFFFNGYPRLNYSSHETHVRVWQCVAIVGVAAIAMVAFNALLPAVLEYGVWHAAWFVPVLVFVITLVGFIGFFVNDDNETEDASLAFNCIGSIVLGVFSLACAAFALRNFNALNLEHITLLLTTALLSVLAWMGAYILGLLVSDKPDYDDHTETMGKTAAFTAGYIVPVGLMCIGFMIASSIGNRWYGPFIAGACAAFMVHIAKMEEDECVSAYSIIGQIVLYLSTIGFSILFGFGVFNMIVCVILIALIINGYPRLIYYGFDTHQRVFQAIGIFACVAVMMLALEVWMPHMIASNFWHALWMAPVIVAAITFGSCMCMLCDDCGNEGGMAVLGLLSLATGLSVLIRCIVLIVTTVDIGGFAMFWFIVLMVITAVIGWFAGAGPVFAIQDNL